MAFDDDITDHVNAFETALCADDGEDLARCFARLREDVAYRNRFTRAFAHMCVARHSTLKNAQSAFQEILHIGTGGQWQPRERSESISWLLANFGLVDWARALRATGADITRCEDGESVLAVAARAKQLAYIDFCVEELGVDPNEGLADPASLDSNVRRHLVDHSRRLTSTRASVTTRPRGRPRRPGL